MRPAACACAGVPLLHLVLLWRGCSCCSFLPCSLATCSLAPVSASLTTFPFCMVLHL